MIVVSFKLRNFPARAARAVRGLRKMFTDFATYDLIVYSTLLAHRMGRFIGAAPVESVTWQICKTLATGANHIQCFDLQLFFTSD